MSHDVQSKTLHGSEPASVGRHRRRPELLVAAQGVTGDDAGRTARGLIKRTFIGDQLISVVITHDELRRLLGAEGSVRAIREKTSSIVLRAVALEMSEFTLDCGVA